VIAEGAAGVHVDHVRTKLGFHSRTQRALRAVDRGLRAELLGAARSLENSLHEVVRLDVAKRQVLLVHGPW